MAAPQPIQYIKLNSFQRNLMAAVSSIIALKNPYRDDMVAVSGETTAGNSLKMMHSKMMKDETGRRILSEQPRITSEIINMDKLQQLPENTFGRKYADMMNKYKITPDSRKVVRFVDDPQHAYVLQRYRETHDFCHLLLDQPTNLKGEVAVKYYEAIQTNLPMCWLAAIGGTVKLEQKRRIALIRKDLGHIVRLANDSTFFLNIYFEERFEQDLDDLRREMKLL